jgi:peroxiredoxin
MRKILKFMLLIGFYAIIISCLRSEGQSEAKPAPSKADSPKEINQVQVSLTPEQIRINELIKKIGLQSVQPGTELMDFELPDLNGQTHKLSSYKGKVIFLNFWATWCPPCRSEMPEMQKLNEVFKNKNFQMLAIDLQESKEAVRTFLNKYGYTFLTLLDASGDAARNYGASSIPLTIIIDKTGDILAGAVGARAWASPEAMEFFQLLVDIKI